MTHDAESRFKAQLLDRVKQQSASLPAPLEMDVSPAGGAVGPELPAAPGNMSQGQADSVSARGAASPAADAVADEDEELDGEQLEQQLRALFEIPSDQPIVIVP